MPKPPPPKPAAYQATLADASRDVASSGFLRNQSMIAGVSSSPQGQAGRTNTQRRTLIGGSV